MVDKPVRDEALLLALGVLGILLLPVDWGIRVVWKIAYYGVPIAFGLGIIAIFLPNRLLKK